MITIQTLDIPDLTAVIDALQRGEWIKVGEFSVNSTLKAYFPVRQDMQIAWGVKGWARVHANYSDGIDVNRWIRALCSALLLHPTMFKKPYGCLIFPFWRDG